MHLIGKHKDKVRLKKVRNEKTGKTGGFQIEHKDGRVAAVVRPEPVRGRIGGA